MNLYQLILIFGVSALFGIFFNYVFYKLGFGHGYENRLIEENKEYEDYNEYEADREWHSDNQ